MRKNSVWRVNLFTVFLVGLLALCACGRDDNPLATDENAIQQDSLPPEKLTLQDYLPLEGSSLSYRFNMSYSTTNNAPEISYQHYTKGICTVTMEKALEYSSSYLLKMTALFNIEADSTFCQKTIFDYEAAGNSNFTIVKSSELLLSEDSLWYVEEDSAGGGIEEGNRNLMMNFSGENGTLRNLNPFLPTGWSLMPWESAEVYYDNTAIVQGDTLVFKIDIYLSNIMIQRGEIKLLRNVGIVSINYSETRGEGTISPKRGQITFNQL
jgi:hypothetical protein